MKDIRKVTYKPYEPKTDWVTRGHYTSVFPILEQPAYSRENIFGAAFLMKYKNETYVVTAKHVANTENSVLLLTGTNRSDIFLSTELFKKLGKNWNLHKTEDLAVLHFKIPEKFKRIVNTSIQPSLIQTSIKPQQIVKHLGYPDKLTGTWKDTKAPNNIPSGASGKIIHVSPNRIVINTPAHQGDSGGPLFLNIQNQPKLIGVITETKVLRSDFNHEDGVYLGKTTALPMSLVYDMIK